MPALDPLAGDVEPVDGVVGVGARDLPRVGGVRARDDDHLAARGLLRLGLAAHPDRVGARAAVGGVRAAAGVDLVVAVAAGDEVLAAERVDLVVAGAAVDLRAAVAVVDDVVAGVAGDRRVGLLPVAGRDLVVAVAAADAVVAVAADR